MLETLSLAGGPPQVVFLAPADGKSLSPNPLTGSSWSADGSSIAFVGGEGKQGRNYVISAADDLPRPVAGTREGFIR